MSALGKLLRTTAFQLTLVYLLVFVLFAVSLLGYFALNTRRLINDQITRIVTTEVARLRLQYEETGIRGLVILLDLRSRRPGSSLYLVTTPNGEGLAGNVGALQPGALDHPGWIETSYRRIDTSDPADHHALVDVVELPAAFASWSAAISRSASASSTSSPMPGAGRSRWSSCLALPAASSSAAACSTASTP